MATPDSISANSSACFWTIGKTVEEPETRNEPSSGPVASWAMPLVTPTGRIYVFYCYNGDSIEGRRADIPEQVFEKVFAVGGALLRLPQRPPPERLLPSRPGRAPAGTGQELG